MQWWGNPHTHPGTFHDYTYTGKDHGMDRMWAEDQGNGRVSFQHHMIHQVSVDRYNHLRTPTMARIKMPGLTEDHANYRQYSCMVAKIIMKRTSLIGELCSLASLSPGHGGADNYQRACDEKFTGEIAVNGGLEADHQNYYPLHRWASVQVSFQDGQVRPKLLADELIDTVAGCTRMATTFMKGSLMNDSLQTSALARNGQIWPGPVPANFKPKITVGRHPARQRYPFSNQNHHLDDDRPYPPTQALRIVDGMSAQQQLKNFTFHFEFFSVYQNSHDSVSPNYQFPSSEQTYKLRDTNAFAPVLA